MSEENVKKREREKGTLTLTTKRMVWKFFPFFLCGPNCVLFTKFDRVQKSINMNNENERNFIDSLRDTEKYLLHAEKRQKVVKEALIRSWIGKTNCSEEECRDLFDYARVLIDLKIVTKGNFLKHANEKKPIWMLEPAFLKMDLKDAFLKYTRKEESSFQIFWRRWVKSFIIILTAIDLLAEDERSASKEQSLKVDGEETIVKRLAEEIRYNRDSMNMYALNMIDVLKTMTKNDTMYLVTCLKFLIGSHE